MPPPVFEEGVYMSHSTATEHAGGAAQRARSLRELEPLEGFLHSAATARPRCQRCGDVLGLFHPQVVLGVPMCSDESASAVVRGGGAGAGAGAPVRDGGAHLDALRVQLLAELAQRRLVVDAEHVLRHRSERLGGHVLCVWTGACVRAGPTCMRSTGGCTGG